MLIEKKILGTVSYMGGVPALMEEFCWSWAQMVQYNAEYLCQPDETIYYTRVKHSFHSNARNELVHIMAGDWLLMMDCDHQFEPDIVKRMLNVMEKYNIPVLVGLYGQRSAGSEPVIYNYNSKTKKFNAILDWPKNSEPFRVDSAGAGCLMVKKEVYRILLEEMKIAPFGIIPPFSEDHSFFINLSNIGIPVYCDPNIEAQHLKIVPVDINKRDIPKNLQPINLPTAIIN